MISSGNVGTRDHPPALAPAPRRLRWSARSSSFRLGVGEILEDLLLRRVFVTAVVVQLLDALSTAAGVSKGLPERNPVTVSLMTSYGRLGLLVPKVLVAGLLLMCLAKLPRRAAVATVMVATALTGYVVGENLASLVAVV